VLALEAAVLAVVAVTRGSARLSDWVSLLLCPAGLALGSVAATALWRSRRGGGHRYVRRTLIALGALVGVYATLLPVAVALYATHRPRADVRPADLRTRRSP
jgi:hypothetical protein